MRAVAGLTALIFAATAATASAVHQTYTGEIRGDGKAVVELEVRARDRGRVVRKFTVRRFPLDCEGGTEARLQRATLKGRAPVSRKGRFALRASNETQRLRVEGKLFGGDEAKGSLEYSGLTEFADQTLECRADDLRWTASL